MCCGEARSGGEDDDEEELNDNGRGARDGNGVTGGRSSGDGDGDGETITGPTARFCIASRAMTRCLSVPSGRAVTGGRNVLPHAFPRTGKRQVNAGFTSSSSPQVDQCGGEHLHA